MPNLDGLDATRIIREVSPKIPVIAVSAYAYEKDKAAAIESGCNEFLTKPISPDLLKDTINKYLKKHINYGKTSRIQNFAYLFIHHISLFLIFRIIRFFAYFCRKK